MSTRPSAAEALPLLLSRRSAGRLLGIDYSGATMDRLIESGKLRLVPWGRRFRIPLEDVQRVAREGFTFDGKRARLRPSRKRTSTIDPDALRKLDVALLARRESP